MLILFLCFPYKLHLLINSIRPSQNVSKYEISHINLQINLNNRFFDQVYIAICNKIQNFSQRSLYRFRNKWLKDIGQFC